MISLTTAFKFPAYRLFLLRQVRFKSPRHRRLLFRRRDRRACCYGLGQTEKFLSFSFALFNLEFLLEREIRADEDARDASAL